MQGLLPVELSATVVETLDLRHVGELRAELGWCLTDWRKPRGKRHRLADVVICSVLAKLCGAQDLAQMARWIGNNRARLGALGLGVVSYWTLRRVAQRIDPAELEAASARVVGRLVGQAEGDGGGWWAAVAVDGKELTGSVGRDAQAVRLVAAWDHRHGHVVAQVRVADKGGEQAAVPGLLEALPGPVGMTVTGDANFSGRPTLAAVSSAGAWWAVSLKGNQAGALEQVAAAGWHESPVAYQAVERGHGRVTRLEVKGRAFGPGNPPPLPGATYAIRVTRATERPNPTAGKHKKKRGTPKPTTPSGRTTRRGRPYKVVEETAYAITSHPLAGDHPYADLYWVMRHHWGIETKLHWVRDVVFREDACQTRVGNAPQFLAILNNLAISLIRVKEGLAANVKAATERAAANLNYALSMLAPASPH
jgi:hypothetical protein